MKRLGTLLLAIAALLAGACTSARPSPTPSPGGDPHGEIAIFVYEHRCQGALVHPWSSIPVYLVVGTERRLLGHTGPTGIIRLKKDDIWVPGAMTLLFCREEDGVECAALNVNTDFLRAFDEFNVQLPQFEIF